MTSESTHTRPVFIYKRFERLWHWCQAALVLLLALTGFEVHGSFEVFGFEKATHLHNVFACAFVVLTAFAIFWHLTTGEWRQYVPTTRHTGDMLAFYTSGIFRGAPHPVKKTELSKLNPLQRLVYLGLKILVIPVQVGSGVLYYYCNAPAVQDHLAGIAFVHTLGAFLLCAFLIIHVYMITSGSTPLSNLKAMLTGWEDIVEEQAEGDESAKA